MPEAAFGHNHRTVGDITCPLIAFMENLKLQSDASPATRHINNRTVATGNGPLVSLDAINTPFFELQNHNPCILYLGLLPLPGSLYAIPLKIMGGIMI